MNAAGDPLAPVVAPRAVTRRHVGVLVFILALGLGVRLAYFSAAIHTPGYEWGDPDGYAHQALKLARDGQGWRWTFNAVTYRIEGRQHALPPGYSVFLSVFALFPGFPITAQVGQIVLAVGAVALVFLIGRLLHSTRTGLVAAAVYAVWIPNIFNVWSTSQETVYLPLMLSGLYLLAKAIAADRSLPAFGAAGLVFGLAALTRSMPIFFIGPAALLHVAMGRWQARAAAQAGVFVLGVLAITGPYSAALSHHFGQLTIIDTHGSIHLSVEDGTQAAGIADTALALAGSVAQDPWTFMAQRLDLVRTLLHVNGGRLLQIYVIAETEGRAVAWKALVHAGADLLLIVGVILAPIGAVICRERRVAAVLVLWTAVNIGITTLGGFSGARLRAPFEAVLVVLASVVLAGGWQRTRPRWLVVGSVFAALGALAVLPQVPRSLAAWPDYGVEWPAVFSRPSGRITGRAGFNVLAPEGFAEFTAAVAEPDHAEVEVEVRAMNVTVKTARLTDGVPVTLRAPWPPGGLAFLDVRARRADDGRPATIDITMPR